MPRWSPRNGRRWASKMLKRGDRLLVATHNPDIAGACDRRIELRDGRLVAARPARTTPALLCANLDAS